MKKSGKLEQIEKNNLMKFDIFLLDNLLKQLNNFKGIIDKIEKEYVDLHSYMEKTIFKYINNKIIYESIDNYIKSATDIRNNRNLKEVGDLKKI